MSTDQEIIEIGSVQVNVVRKDIKNMHLAVYPPEGKVRLSAPTSSDEQVLRLFAISKLGWIKKHVKNFKEQARESERSYVNGESHYYQGKRYILKVRELEGKSSVEIKGTKKLMLTCKPKATASDKAHILKEWYRSQLKAQIPELIEKWQEVIGVEAKEWGVKQMKTKWGSCNPDIKRIWLNLELAKKPPVCLEYILVHELVHLHERNHNDRFIKLMDEFMPKWRLHRDLLNSLPIVHNDWGY